MVCQNFVNAGLADIRDHFAELPNRHPSIFQHVSSTFAIVSSETNGRPGRCSSWTSVRLSLNSLHYLRTCCTLIHTERNLHLAGEASGSSISNGCQAKTEHHRQLTGVGTGRGGTELHASAPGSRVTAFLATAAPWEPYFTDNLHIFLILRLDDCWLHIGV
jgi:hypothetical protein